MAQTAPTIRPPKPVDPATGSAMVGGAQVAGRQVAAAQSKPPSGIAQPPAPRQTATGGYTSTPLARNPTPVAPAVRQTGALLTTPAKPAAPQLSTLPIAQQIQQVTAGTAKPGQLGPNAATIYKAGGTSTANPTAGIAQDPVDEANIGSANAAYEALQGQVLQGQYGAAQAYGDPGQEARFGLAAPNPDSALANAARIASQQRQADINARGRSNTLFSSLGLQDQANIADTQRRSELGGYQTYQNALAKLQNTLTTGMGTRDAAVRAAQADERSKAISNLTTPDQASGSAAAGVNNAGTTTPKSSGTPRPSSKGAKAPKPPPTAKAPKGKTSSIPKVSSRRR